jgi:hypothetical protein
VLGLAVDGLFDTCRAELSPGRADEVVEVSACDADLVPRDPGKNCANVAARALLDAAGELASPRRDYSPILALASAMAASRAG